MSIYSRITGTGSYLPQKCLTNQDMEKIVDTSDKWIVARTGIRQRHIAADDQNASDLAYQASLHAIKAAGIKAGDIDLIIVATSTPDMIFPSTATLLQNKLGIKNNGAAFDVQAVCSGFVYALAMADKFIRCGDNKCALVIGAEIFSRILDWNDRGTCVLFGDGAGAVILQASDKPGILSSHLHADGSYNNILCVPGTLNRGKPMGDPLLKMEGQAVFKFAVKVLEDVVLEALSANNMTTADIDWLIPHQANTRIISATGKKLGINPEKVVITVDQHGNTSAASIPLALDVAVRDGRIQRGDHVMLEGVGGGFTWGAVFLQW
ncbi:MAG: beta-ketoacyl-ACP synthase III [Burkholderiales bacterium]